QTFFFIGCLGAYLARLRKVPLFFTYHTRFTEYAHYMPVHQRVTKAQAVWISREFCNRCDRIIAPTLGTVELLHSYGVDRPVSIIPSGVDVHGFDHDAPTPAVIAQARPGLVLLYAGRLAKEKNLDLLLDAFSLFHDRRPDAHLVVVGDGPHRAELEQRTQAAAWGALVHFVGELPQRELGPYYRDADAFVFASTTETQGLVLLEALAHGLPALAVDCAVTREVVGQDAGILTGASAADLAQAFAEFADESPQRRELRRVAALDAAAPLSVDTLATDLEELYLQAASRLTAAH
ncbi:MAG: glycosyltransferase, partial [Candidatus Eremiobacteraeota bacterium]|nr:glycosyltransferase [Candidatus Eremiobacteraeota bacterium]